MDELLLKCYQILGVKAGATKEEVEQAYNYETKTWQPERFSDDLGLYQKAQEKIKEINWAYETLNKYFANVDEQIRLNQNTKKPDVEIDRGTFNDKTFNTPNTRKFAGFWIRFSAVAIDNAVLIIPNLMLSYLINSTTPDGTETIYNFSIGVLVMWVYHAAFVSSTWQGTIDKMILGLKVVDYSGNRITFGRATARYFSQWLSMLILSIGFMMVGWTKKKQGLHDFVAETRVIRS